MIGKRIFRVKVTIEYLVEPNEDPKDVEKELNQEIEDFGRFTVWGTSDEEPPVDVTNEPEIQELWGESLD